MMCTYHNVNFLALFVQGVRGTLSAEALSAYDIISHLAQPHLGKMMSAAKVPDLPDMPCKSEIEAVWECLGYECVDCFVEIAVAMEEDTTCEDLENGPFCDDVLECLPKCNFDCEDPAEDLMECAEEHYPDESSKDDECPGLCEDGSSLFLVE